MKKTISIIVALDKNNGIGKDNQLLCHLPEDLKRFKRLTEHNVVVMGKKTYESLPGRPLPNRENIVLSDNPADDFEGCIMARSLEDALNKCSEEKENFIIGGGSVYSQFMPFANKLYLTQLHTVFEADTFFPEIDQNEWTLVEKEDIVPENPCDLAFSYVTLKRR